MVVRVALRLALLLGLCEAIFHLDLGHDTVFYWDLDYHKGEVIVEVHSTNFDPEIGWTGIGFSNNGDIKDGSGDYCVVWKSQLGPDSDNLLQLTDVHIEEGTSTIAEDSQQDCLDFRHVYRNGTLKWTFRRKFVTCDLNDYAIEEGTTHLHWVKGNGPLYNINGVSITKAFDVGFIRVRLRKNLTPDPVLDPDSTWKLEVINAKVKVPAVETMYWCHVMKLPETLKKKHHIVQFAVNVQKGNEDLVHHMEVFHCEINPTADLPLYSGPCDQSPKEISPCNRVMGAWAMGAEPLHYPAETGFPIGGEDFSPYVRLEIHYNNPAMKADWVDSSGMTFWVTPQHRPFDAGVIELGLEYTDKNSIPPGEEEFTLTGVCNFECTSVGLPQEGITVFASQLHTHLTGVRVVTRHFRKRAHMLKNTEANANFSHDDASMSYNFLKSQSSHVSNSDSKGDIQPNWLHSNDEFVELPTFNWDNHYSTHFQEIRLLKKPIKVLPGDVLLTSCDYQTTNRTKMTLGGFAITDEMCVNYIHYYPRSKLEVCKSSVAWPSLRNYFNFMANMENQHIDPEGPVSDNYNGIQWTPFRAKLLSDFYNTSPIDMQCNQSDGSRFPGSWNSMDVPAFPPLQPKPNLNADCLLALDDVKELNIGYQ